VSTFRSAEGPEVSRRKIVPPLCGSQVQYVYCRAMGIENGDLLSLRRLTDSMYCSEIFLSGASFRLTISGAGDHGRGDAKGTVRPRLLI
jgi:hypothetical protein